jgi:hypothetical protein
MSATTYTPCRCGCRAPDAPVPCACKECSPGPGLDYAAKRRAQTQPNEARMMHLLHSATLTEREQTELDNLLDWYIHR